MARRISLNLVCGMVLLMVATGCKGLRGKVDNPVMPAPPSRVSHVESENDEELAANEDQSAGIIQTSLTPGSVDDTALFNASVVARVNGAPVFASEVLDRYGDYLRKAREQLPTDKYVELREAIIQKDLRSHIERRLVVERMKSTLKPAQIEAVNKEIEKQFEQSEVPRLKKELKANTKTELEIELGKRGTSLANIRETWGNQQIALQYLMMKSEKPKSVNRADLLEYYESHMADYAVAARVHWRQIEFPTTAQTRQSAADAAQRAVRALEAGQPFAQVAKTHSKGPKAEEGGDWGWTRRGSLASENLENRLFEAPIGQPSEAFFLDGSYRIIEVIEREAAGQRSFEDVQDEIRDLLKTQQRSVSPQKALEELWAEAIIETEYNVSAVPTP